MLDSTTTPILEVAYGIVRWSRHKIVWPSAAGRMISRRNRFPTTGPQEVIAIAFFREQALKSPIAAVGIASFGPIDPDPSSQTWGFVTTTPKPGWAHTDFAGAIQRALRVPVGFDTDVNGAALGEYRWGAAQGLDTFIYLTVGTGIGGGVMANGRLLHGLMHPEMGLRVPRLMLTFPGICLPRYCLEGLWRASDYRAHPAAR